MWGHARWPKDLNDLLLEKSEKYIFPKQKARNWMSFYAVLFDCAGFESAFYFVIK